MLPLPNLLHIDFHCHTLYSKDCASSLEKVIAKARQVGLHRLIITDHNTIQGALLAQKMAPDLIIIGEEIETGKGEILAAFVQEEVPAGLPIGETICRLRDQGAFIALSHPLDGQRTRWRSEDLKMLSSMVDAVEVFNARCMFSSMNRAAASFAHNHGLPGVAGSDAHSIFEIGRVRLLTPEFTNAQDLRRVLPEGKLSGSLSPYWVHLFSRIATLRKFITKK